MINDSNMLSKIISRFSKLLPILFVILSIPAIYGYDGDFGYYATAAKMISSGLGMYEQVYDHKPPLYHHTLLLGVYINTILETDLFGFFVFITLSLGAFILAAIYCLNRSLLPQISNGVITLTFYCFHF